IRNNPEEGSQHSYVDLEKLAKRWEKKSMKELTLWRGIWRIWVIGTVGWAVWTFWKSDPRCIITLVDPSVGGPGCQDRGSEWYLELLVSMFGWSALITILILAVRWVIAGFWTVSLQRPSWAISDDLSPEAPEIDDRLLRRSQASPSGSSSWQGSVGP